MVEPNLVLLSASDLRADVNGEYVFLTDGMSVNLEMQDFDSDGNKDHLIASGSVELNTFRGWASHVKWCCRIDTNGIRHSSD